MTTFDDSEGSKKVKHLQIIWANKNCRLKLENNVLSLGIKVSLWFGYSTTFHVSCKNFSNWKFPYTAIVIVASNTLVAHTNRARKTMNRRWNEWAILENMKVFIFIFSFSHHSQARKPTPKTNETGVWVTTKILISIPYSDYLWRQWCGDGKLSYKGKVLCCKKTLTFQAYKKEGVIKSGWG